MKTKRTTRQLINDKCTFQKNGCWMWSKPLNIWGYAVWSEREDGKYKQYRVMRRIYEETVRPIPKGLVLDHLCRNRACVNPDHLEPVTIRENALRGISATKTHCKNGHRYTLTNTYSRQDRPGHRECKKCRDDASRRYNLRLRSSNNTTQRQSLAGLGA